MLDPFRQTLHRPRRRVSRRTPLVRDRHVRTAFGKEERRAQYLPLRMFVADYPIACTTLIYE
jgi:hypothetical protein